MRELTIRGDMIRLGQMLKLAGLIGSGAEAKALLADDSVQVNRQTESRRGRQLHDGDVVSVGGQDVLVRTGPVPGRASDPEGR